MKRAIPAESEYAFVRWESWKRWERPVLWAFVPPLIILAYLLWPSVPENGGSQVTYESRLIVILLWVLIVFVVLVYAAVPLIIRQWVFKPMIGGFSRGASIFAAMVAVEDLKRGDTVRASLAITKLLSALSDFLERKSATLWASNFTPKDIMHVRPEEIPKRAVLKAVQISGSTRDFQKRLSNLAIGLTKGNGTGYLEVHRFLIWLDKKTEPYQLGARGFFERRPTFKTLMVNLGPAAIALIGTIVVAFLK